MDTFAHCFNSDTIIKYTYIYTQQNIIFTGPPPPAIRGLSSCVGQVGLMSLWLARLNTAGSGSIRELENIISDPKRFLSVQPIFPTNYPNGQELSGDNNYSLIEFAPQVQFNFLLLGARSLPKGLFLLLACRCLPLSLSCLRPNVAPLRLRGRCGGAGEETTARVELRSWSKYGASASCTPVIVGTSASLARAIFWTYAASLCA